MLIDTLLADDVGAFFDALHHLILPAIVLGTIPLAVIARMTRSSMLEVCVKTTSVPPAPKACRHRAWCSCTVCVTH
jgi:ABC-type antimicrobial peptide transport system permease subunit